MKAQPDSHWPRFYLSRRLSEDRVAIFRSDSESLIQSFEAIRPRAWCAIVFVNGSALKKARTGGNNFGTSALFRTGLAVKTQSFF